MEVLVVRLCYFRADASGLSLRKPPGGYDVRTKVFNRIGAVQMVWRVGFGTAAALWLSMAIASAQDFSSVAVETIISNRKYAKGLAWQRDPSALLVSDPVSDEILRLVAGQRPVILHKDVGHPAGMALDGEGRLYVCEPRNRRVVRFDGKGQESTVADKFEGKALNAPQDIAVRKDGHVYFTDPAFASAERRKELDFYGIYHVTPKGEMEVIDRRKTRPNGVAVSPDGKRLFVTDSDLRQVITWELDRGGRASKEQVLVDKIPAVPSGITVDAQGHVFVATDKVMIYNHEGQLLRYVDLPQTPSSCTLGGQDNGILFVGARTAVYGIVLHPEVPANQ